ncbi:MAG: hypothetical protein ABIH80_07120 [Methanobacteriota archaeon]
MDKIETLKGHGLWTKVKNAVEPGAENILGAVIPGYDYRAKKNRLNTDHAVRNKLSRELEKSYKTLVEVSDLAYKDDKRDIVDHIKDALNTIDQVRKEIEHAGYGMSPLFTQDGVDNRNIIRMIEFDAKLLDELVIITEASGIVYDNVLAGKTSDIVQQIRNMKRSVDRIRNLFSDRNDYLINLA